MSTLDDLYRDLHTHPELSFQEHRTASIVAERMRGLGLTVTEGVLGGARAMASDPSVTALPRPAVVLGQHDGPLPAGVVSLMSGAAMAGFNHLAGGGWG